MAKFTLTAGIAVLAVPLLLAGCSGDSYSIAALKAPAGPNDVLPEGVNLPFPLKIDEESLRFLAEDGGRQYFAAESVDGAEACIAVLSVDQQFGGYVGCGAAAASSANRIITVGGPDGKSTTLVRDNANTGRLESEGLRRIHQNVYVAG